MLISFSVANFLSFRERVELNMLAFERDDSLLSNISTLPRQRTRGPKEMKLLKSAAIYGPNASGKSNLLKALRLAFHIIHKSVVETDCLKALSPFLLDSSTRDKPSEFELSFIVNGKIYRYGFLVSTSFVIEEWFFVAENGPEKLLFERLRDENSGVYTYTFGPAGKKQFKALTEHVRTDTLLLSVAAQFNAAYAQDVVSHELININGVDQTWIVVDTSEEPFPTEDDLNTLTALLQYADIGLEQLELEQFPKTSVLYAAFKKYGTKGSATSFHEYARRFKFIYKDCDKKTITIPEEQQSQGTKYLLNFFISVLKSYKHGRIFICDEIETSLHPHLCAAFLHIFHKLPDNNSQLIFSTHDATLLNADVLRRDQVYIMEKNQSGQSTILSLIDYNGIRKYARLGKHYLDGLFGGLPFLSGRKLRDLFESLDGKVQDA